MNDNTILRIKVPAHLYESVKEQLTLKEFGPSIANVSKARFKLKDVINWFTKKYQAKELKHGFKGQFKDFINRLKSSAEYENGYIPVNYVYHDINDYVAYWPSEWSREERSAQEKLQNKHAKELYSAIRSELKMYDKKGNSINEVKAKAHYGAGMEVVKEKKMKVPKDGMKKVEEVNQIEETDKEMEKKTRTLDELKKAKDALDKKINEMEGMDKVEEIDLGNLMDPNFIGGVAAILGVGVPLVAAAIKDMKKAKTPEEKAAVRQKLAKAAGSALSGDM